MFDAVMPRDQASYDQFAQVRPGLLNRYNDGSRTRESLLALEPGNAANFGGRQFGLAPELATVKSLFDSGEAAIVGADMIFVAVPSGSCREVSVELAKYIRSDTMVISTTKGIEHQNFKLMSEVLTEALPENPLGVLSGPNLAKEIAARHLTGTVVASSNTALIEKVQNALHSSYFRVYGSSDLYGVELSGALKNIYAIISGLGAAMHLGDNTRAMLMTRSLAEMSRFAVSMGANPMTFLGLAGVGDLIVTCSSSLSRNYQVGFAIGSGKTLKQATEELGQVAEGVNTLKLVKLKADDNGVYMPLASGLYEILFNNVSVEDTVSQLMLGEQSEDVEFLLADD